MDEDSKQISVQCSKDLIICESLKGVVTPMSVDSVEPGSMEIHPVSFEVAEAELMKPKSMEVEPGEPTSEMTSEEHQISQKMKDKQKGKCALCSANFNTYRDLKNHSCDPSLLPEGEIGRIKCKFCPKMYSSNFNMQRHFKHRHSDTLTKPQPPPGHPTKSTKSQVAVIENLRPTSQKTYRPIFCFFCEKILIGFTDLGIHIRALHVRQKKKYPELFESDKILRELFKEENKLFPCSYCDKLLVGKKELHTHQRVLHKKELAIKKKLKDAKNTRANATSTPESILKENLPQTGNVSHQF